MIRFPLRLVSEGRPLSQRRCEIVSVLDIGSTKILCLIARLHPCAEMDVLPERTHAIEILGYGYQQSQGVKAGNIVDMGHVERGIRLAVDAAERMAGLTIESLIVTVGCGRLKSVCFPAEIALGGRAVTRGDLQRVILASQSQALPPERVPLHTLPVSYALDAMGGLANPYGMVGEKLSVDLHVVSAELSPLRNLERVLNQADLQVAAMVAAPYASGLSTLVGDESQLGAICIDLGGGTTSLSVFYEGNLLHVDALALGGKNITQDVARSLSIDLHEAERIKTLYGSVLPSTDLQNGSEIPLRFQRELGEGERIPYAFLSQIISARFEEIFEVLRDRLNHGGFSGFIGRGVVLTGGGSQTAGLSELVRRLLGRHVRLGRPAGVSKLSDSIRGPASAAAVGLLVYPQVAQIWQKGQATPYLNREKGGYLARVGRWLRESF